MSGKPNLTWHKWFHSWWLFSSSRLEMTAAERGVYRDCLDFCYAEGSIPADPETLRRLLQVTPEEFQAAWPKVSKRFVPNPDDPTRLINLRADEVIGQTAKYVNARSQAGKKSGAARRGTNADQTMNTPGTKIEQKKERIERVERDIPLALSPEFLEWLKTQFDGGSLSQAAIDKLDADFLLKEADRRDEILRAGKPYTYEEDFLPALMDWCREHQYGPIGPEAA